MDKFMATLGDNLKSIRKAKKMTQKELAQKSGVKQSVISDLETGNAKSTGSILELANALGVTAEELKKVLLVRWIITLLLLVLN
jgi:transcriptional regulator with XRE-family HTH domain